MDNTITALRNLYVALGGSSGTVANLNIIPDLINAIATLISSKGGMLPKAAQTDNGKVLTVDATGAWVAANPASQLPAVSADNDGEVLTVVSGAWAAADLPT